MAHNSKKIRSTRKLIDTSVRKISTATKGRSIGPLGALPKDVRPEVIVVRGSDGKIKIKVKNNSAPGVSKLLKDIINYSKGPLGIKTQIGYGNKKSRGGTIPSPKPTDIFKPEDNVCHATAGSKGPTGGKKR